MRRQNSDPRLADAEVIIKAIYAQYLKLLEIYQQQDKNDIAHRAKALTEIARLNETVRKFVTAYQRKSDKRDSSHAEKMKRIMMMHSIYHKTSTHAVELIGQSIKNADTAKGVELKSYKSSASSFNADDLADALDNNEKDFLAKYQVLQKNSGLKQKEESVAAKPLAGESSIANEQINAGHNFIRQFLDSIRANYLWKEDAAKEHLDAKRKEIQSNIDAIDQDENQPELSANQKYNYEFLMEAFTQAEAEMHELAKHKRQLNKSPLIAELRNVLSEIDTFVYNAQGKEVDQHELLRRHREDLRNKMRNLHERYIKHIDVYPEDKDELEIFFNLAAEKIAIANKQKEAPAPLLSSLIQSETDKINAILDNPNLHADVKAVQKELARLHGFEANVAELVRGAQSGNLTGVQIDAPTYEVATREFIATYKHAKQYLNGLMQPRLSEKEFEREIKALKSQAEKAVAEIKKIQTKPFNAVTLGKLDAVQRQLDACVERAESLDDRTKHNRSEQTEVAVSEFFEFIGQVYERFNRMRNIAREQAELTRLQNNLRTNNRGSDMQSREEGDNSELKGNAGGDQHSEISADPNSEDSDNPARVINVANNNNVDGGQQGQAPLVANDDDEEDYEETEGNESSVEGDVVPGINNAQDPIALPPPPAVQNAVANANNHVPDDTFEEDDDPNPPQAAQFAAPPPPPPHFNANANPNPPNQGGAPLPPNNAGPQPPQPPNNPNPAVAPAQAAPNAALDAKLEKYILKMRIAEYRLAMLKRTIQEGGPYLKQLLTSSNDPNVEAFDELNLRQDTFDKAKKVVEELKKQRSGRNHDVDGAKDDYKDALQADNDAEDERREHGRQPASSAINAQGDITEKQQREIFDKMRNDTELKEYQLAIENLVYQAKDADKIVYDAAYIASLHCQIDKYKRDLADYDLLLDEVDDPNNNQIYGSRYSRSNSTVYGDRATIAKTKGIIRELIGKLSTVEDIVNYRANAHLFRSVERAHYQADSMDQNDPNNLVQTYNKTDAARVAQINQAISTYIGTSETHPVTNIAVNRGDRGATGVFTSRYVPTEMIIKQPGALFYPDGKKIKIAVIEEVNASKTLHTQTFKAVKLSEMDSAPEGARLDFAMQAILRGKASVTKGPVIIPKGMSPKMKEAFAKVCEFMREEYVVDAAVRKVAVKSEKATAKYFGEDQRNPLGARQLAGSVDPKTDNISFTTEPTSLRPR